MKLTFIVILLSIFHLSTSDRNPIILIPGVAGSQIEVKMDDNADIEAACKKDSEDYFSLWMNTMYCLTHSPSCIYKVLQMDYDKTTRLTSNREGINIRIPGFGSTDKSGDLDTIPFMAPYFNSIINRLIRKGYIPGSTIRAAPYDFRKGPHEQMDYLRRLEALIVNTYEKNGQQKIILIVHSLGGLLTLMLLKRKSEMWKNQYIQSLITLSVGWGGSVKAIEAYMKVSGVQIGEVGADSELQLLIVVELFATQKAHSPDLAPSNHHLFPCLKGFLGGKQFNNDEELQLGVRTYFTNLDARYYANGMEKLIVRYDKCRNLGGFSIRLAEVTSMCPRFSTEPLMQRSQSYISLPKLTLVPNYLLRTLPSVIWLFPSYKAWEKTDVLVRSRTPETKTYTLNNMQEFFADLGDNNGWEMYNDIESFHKEVSDPGVNLHCLYGFNIDTVALVDHSTSFWDFLKFPITDDGDGMVNLQSLQICEKWSENTRVKTKSFKGVSHYEILHNSKVLNHIIDVINNNY